MWGGVGGGGGGGSPRSIYYECTCVKRGWTSKIMSDRLIDLEVELRDVVVALKDVAGTQWYDLGLQLQLRGGTNTT